MTFWGLSKDFLRTFYRLSMDFLRTFWGLSEDFLKTFSGNFSKVSQDFFYTFLRTFWDLSEDFLQAFDSRGCLVGRLVGRSVTMLGWHQAYSGLVVSTQPTYLRHTDSYTAWIPMKRLKYFFGSHFWKSILTTKESHILEKLLTSNIAWAILDKSPIPALTL